MVEFSEDDIAGTTSEETQRPLLTPVFEMTEKVSSVIEQSPIWERVEEYTGKLSEREDIQRAKALLLGQIIKPCFCSS